MLPISPLMKKSNLVASSLALLWGVAVVLYAVVSSGSHSGGSFGAGQTAGAVFGALLLIAGARGLIKEVAKRST